MPIPVVIGDFDNVNDLISSLKRGYHEYYNEYPKIEESKVWESLDSKFMEKLKEYTILAECPVISLERADYLAIDIDKALVIEAKGWRDIKIISERVVIADGEKHIDPYYQLQGYVSKFNYFHSSSEKMKFRGIIFLYNNRTYENDKCTIVHTINELEREIESLGSPGGRSEIEAIINGKFRLSDDLIRLIKENRKAILENASEVLLGRGYGLTEEQTLLVDDVLTAVRNKKCKDKTFVVNGQSGSGKTLVAIQLLLESVSDGYNALLAYRNNRLLNTLREVLRTEDGKDFSSFIQFYSTGRNMGIGEEGFNINKFGNVDLIIYDEAQRMTESVIKRTQERSRVKVYFYDDSQILIGDEVGTKSNFLKYSKNFEERHLSSIFRTPKNYIKYVRHLLWDENAPESIDFEIKIYDDITKMIGDLSLKKATRRKVALLCAFTESKGDKKNPKGLENRRLGYPLPSGLDIYKDKGIDIYWLMNEKTEYPQYWMGELDSLNYCASVYGSQGFEADYTGLVWGRDLIWRNGWQINPDPIRDMIGAQYSLKNTIRKDPKKAIDLLKNRYYVLLTRSIKGTYIFFEDEETGIHVKEEISKIQKE